jgi:hypothetical protein
MKHDRRKPDRRKHHCTQDAPSSAPRVLSREVLEHVVGGGGGVTHLDEWNHQT